MVDLSLLQSFSAFVGAKNIVEAARELGISQPALSSRLKMFERAFDQPVFTMQGRRKLLTPFGQALYDETKESLKRPLEQCFEVTRRFSDPAQVTLKLGGRREPLEHLLPKLRFAGSLQFENLKSGEAIEAVKDRRIDIALAHQKPDSLGLVARLAFREGATLVWPKAWKRSELWERPCIGYRADLPFLTEFCASEKRSVSDLRISRLFEDWQQVARFVSEGVGWSIIPERILPFAGNARSEMLSTSIAKPMSFYWIYRKCLSGMPFFNADDFFGAS